MSDTISKELLHEQEHFDTAWAARERKRSTLVDAPNSAAGSRAAVSAVSRAAQREAAAIGSPEDAVAFGRFDTTDGEVVYVGKQLISTEERDTLVINWKTPFAEPYFAATYDDPCGLRLRRKFETVRNTIQAFEDVVFEDLARRVGELTGLEQSGIDDTVLRDLEKDRTGEMQDIVQTIHASQYGLVRAPLDRLLIVQGGPGTGKTVVALHRVSWLLFNNMRDLTPADVLVVGPNPTFTKYIKSVLPGLGDNEVSHRDLLQLGPVASSSRRETSDVSRLKGELRMAELLRVGLDQRIRISDRTEDLEVGQGVQFSPQELGELVGRLGALPYSAGRAAARAGLADLTAQRSSAAINPNQIDNALERVWPSLTPVSFLRDLMGSRERLVAAAGDDFTAGDVSRLLRAPAERISEEMWSDADIALLDEADALINGHPQTYAHLVIDEAQDLSPMQLRSLRRRSTNGSMTVVGDLAQSTGPWARDSWEDVAAALADQFPTQMEELALGYRVPRQVFELAAQLLPEAAPNIVPPRVIRVGPESPRLDLVDRDDVVPEAISIAQQQASMGLFVGVICPASLRSDAIETLNKRGIAFSDASKGGIGKSINLVSPSEAKGLEFDSVVVLEPERIVDESDRGLRMLYVAFTRTTRYLSVVHSGRVLPLTSVPIEPEVLPPAVAEVRAGEQVESSRPIGEIGAVTTPAPPSDDQSDHTRQPETGPYSPSEDAPAVSVPPASSASPLNDAVSELSDQVVAAAAASLAEGVRAGVPPMLWPRVLDKLRRELEVTSDQTLELLD